MNRHVFLFLFALLAFGVAMTPPAQAICNMRMAAELKITMQGHRAIAPVKINGADAKMIVDTGAFWNSITPGGAAKYRLSLRSEPDITISGVGGKTDNVSVGTAQDFSIASASYHGVTFVLVDKGLDSGAVGLLGENFLSNADVEYDLANGVIRLFKPDGCSQTDLSYWVGPQQPYSIIDMEYFNPGNAGITSFALVNGQRVHVLFDTGAGSSILSTKAAWKAGVQPTDADVVAADGGAGVAKRSYIRTWLAPFASFRVGDEEIKNVKLTIGNMRLDYDMLLGADFFLSHRVLVSNSQHKIYFTYNGGPVFDQATSQTPPPPTITTSGLAPPTETMDADSYSRHAAALASRKDFDGALSDLNKAIELGPNNPRYVYERAMIYRAKAQPKLDLDDLNQSLTLQPDYIPALLARAAIYHASGEPARARADLDAADRAASAHPDDRLTIAEGYLRANLEAEAIEELSQWIETHPKDDDLAQALDNRCWLRALRGEALNDALTDCDAALRLQPGDPDVLNSRGLVYLRLGQFDKAISDYKDSLSIRPKLAWALYGRGLAELKKGMKAEGDADIAAAEASSATIVDEAAKRGLTP